MLMRLLQPNNLVGCGREPPTIRLATEHLSQSLCRGETGAQRRCKCVCGGGGGACGTKGEIKILWK